MTNSNLITIDEFKAYAPEIDVSSFSDPTLSGFISMASLQVSDYLEYTPLQETITDEVKNATITSEGDLLIFPNKLPIQSLSSLKIFKGATEVEITLLSGNGLPKYNIDFTKRNLRYPAGELTLQGVPIFTNFYALRGSQFFTKITYVGGYLNSDLPETMKLATSYYVRELLSRRMNTSGAIEISQGGIRLKFAERDGKSDLVKDAERLLAPYRRLA